MQPPAQELIARDLHDNEWKFRHIFRGRYSFLDIFSPSRLLFASNSYKGGIREMEN